MYLFRFELNIRRPAPDQY